MFLGQVAHEAMQGDKVRFTTALDGASQIDQAAVGGSLPKGASRRIVSCWAAVALAPRLDILDGVLLLASNRSRAVHVQRIMRDNGMLGWRRLWRCMMRLMMRLMVRRMVVTVKQVGEEPDEALEGFVV